MKKTIQLISILWMGATLIHLSGCKKDDPNYVLPPPAVTGVGLATNQTLGSILTDSKGNTLYLFSNDAHGESTCTSGCDQVWPVFYVANPTLPTGLASTDFAEITRADGNRQTTYKGYPLYYYSPTADGKLENPGETNGDNVGKIWFAAKPSYTVMISSQQLVGADGKNYTSAGVEGQETNSYLTDANGRTIYMFSGDTRNNNNFTAADLSNNTVWPIFDASITDFPTGFASSDFKEIDVFGQKQLTYKGHPLYYFGGNSTTAGDVNRGETRGVSFPAPGVWHVATSATTDAPASINLMQTATGMVLADSKGRSLYLFSKDTDKTSHCTGGCPNTWPVFYTDVLTVSDGSLNEADFDAIALPDGTKQTTYKGWPLHYFAPAANSIIETAGSTGGDGFANLWYVAKSNYSLMIANAQLIGSDGKSYTSDEVEGTGATTYFVDGNGRTLYRFATDANGQNKFTHANLDNNTVFPIFDVALADLPSAMSRADFGEITVFGLKQLTYKGYPLYYFGGNATTPGDVNRGDTRAVSFPNPGVWPIVNKATPVAP